MPKEMKPKYPMFVEISRSGFEIYYICSSCGYRTTIRNKCCYKCGHLTCDQKPGQRISGRVIHSPFKWWNPLSWFTNEAWKVVLKDENVHEVPFHVVEAFTW